VCLAWPCCLAGSGGLLHGREVQSCQLCVRAERRAVHGVSPVRRRISHLEVRKHASSGMRAASGGKVSRDAGPVKGGSTHIAFVDDPTGYKWELIQRSGNIPEPIAQARPIHQGYGARAPVCPSRACPSGQRAPPISRLLTALFAELLLRPVHPMATHAGWRQQGCQAGSPPYRFTLSMAALCQVGGHQFNSHMAGTLDTRGYAPLDTHRGQQCSPCAQPVDVARPECAPRCGPSITGAFHIIPPAGPRAGGR